MRWLTGDRGSGRGSDSGSDSSKALGRGGDCLVSTRVPRRDVRIIVADLASLRHRPTAKSAAQRRAANSSPEAGSRHGYSRHRGPGCTLAWL
ncbi:hypothetical protein HMPREF1624_02924 [Sporothrix schenckii ATCC 58251]|uniref:Uncharacterized protein n=1 Tax=Sporothrix schenckii (strain ATCC 58251 / de Perez 2211183) TaxID=1391915 RepID=U7Q3B4_SPOS1|nr:hypothetical protein HMPREF1624_02924 [Sporothrix schenckii ATCC 58251]